MEYTGKVEYAQERKMRTRNTRIYRSLHWPIWIWVFFLAPWTAHLFSSLRTASAWATRSGWPSVLAGHWHRRPARQAARSRAGPVHSAL